MFFSSEVSGGAEDIKLYWGSRIEFFILNNNNPQEKSLKLRGVF